MFVAVSLTAKRYLPSGTGSPCATALAGPAATKPTATTAAVSPIRRTAVLARTGSTPSRKGRPTHRRPPMSGRARPYRVRSKPTQRERVATAAGDEQVQPPAQRVRAERGPRERGRHRVRPG